MGSPINNANICISESQLQTRYKDDFPRQQVAWLAAGCAYSPSLMFHVQPMAHALDSVPLSNSSTTLCFPSLSCQAKCLTTAEVGCAWDEAAGQGGEGSLLLENLPKGLLKICLNSLASQGCHPWCSEC